MEEEGIYYFFEHSASSHQMIVTDAASQHPAVAGQISAVYDEVTGGVRDDMRVTAWDKSQELRSGEYTLWDHSFELPGNTLEVKEKTTSEVRVGKVTHKLNIGGNDQLEIYEYPGGYAQRFDGIDRNGAERRQDLKHILEDGERTARIRMEEQEARSLEISGASDCGNFTAGHVFALERHFDADGKYLLTRVEHDIRPGGYRSGQDLEFSYQNRFTCIPDTLPYRPPRLTERPLIAGIQTATVVGPHGEEIFCDKYGRVKVQFHWDREGQKDQASSCWVRVSQVWAGKGWGAFFWPRIGHEVVVAFEDGNPDQPLIVGSVYNAENMPWFNLPQHKQLAGFKSASVRGIAQKNYNGIVFNDTKGHEHLAIHSERNLSLNSEYDKMIHAGRAKGERVSVANMLTVGNLVPGGGSGGGKGTQIDPGTALNPVSEGPTGGSQYGKGFDSADPMPEPPPTGVLGLNSVMVYGENLQAVTGMSHQIAVGNNVQICVNPAGLAAGVPGLGPAASGILTAAMGSGLGGNMQFTLGASVQFTLGQSIELSVGPPKIEFHDRYRDHPWCILFSSLLGAAVIVWVIAYAACKQDHTRATMAIVFELLTDTLLGGLMAAAIIEKWHDEEDPKKTMDALYKTAGWKLEEEWWKLDVPAGIIGALAAIAVPLAAIAGENQDDQQTAYQGGQPSPVKSGNVAGASFKPGNLKGASR
jgi:type VI secretion system VgrG family protein